MAKAAEMVSEKPATAIRQAGDTLGIGSPQEAKAKIASIRADRSHPYNDPKASPKAKQAATAEMSTLYQIANPEEER